MAVITNTKEGELMTAGINICLSIIKLIMDYFRSQTLA
jgi:hypothetical protein